MAARDTLEEEFREFVAARSAALLRTAYLLAGDWGTAEDLLQTALTKTYLAWKRLGEIEAVEPYARRVLVNTATSWWRRRWHGERPTDVLPEPVAPDQIEQQLERDALWRHVRALPVRQRAVLVLRFYEDLSEAQTAALLNIAPGTVKSQTFRALNTLRQRLHAEAEAAGRAETAGRAEAAGRADAAGRPEAAGRLAGADRAEAVSPTEGAGRVAAAVAGTFGVAAPAPANSQAPTSRTPAGEALTRAPQVPRVPPARTVPPSAPVPAVPAVRAEGR